MMKPRLAPAKPATPEAPPTTPPESGGQQPQGSDANASTCERTADGSGELLLTSEELMDTETSTTFT
jgi:hypothetical protein